MKKNTFLMVSVSPEFDEKIKEYAKGIGLSKSAFVRQTLIKAIKEDKQNVNR